MSKEIYHFIVNILWLTPCSEEIKLNYIWAHRLNWILSSYYCLRWLCYFSAMHWTDVKSWKMTLEVDKYGKLLFKKQLHIAHLTMLDASCVDISRYKLNLQYWTSVCTRNLFCKSRLKLSCLYLFLRWCYSCLMIYVIPQMQDMHHKRWLILIRVPY